MNQKFAANFFLCATRLIEAPAFYALFGFTYTLTLSLTASQPAHAEQPAVRDMLGALVGMIPDQVKAVTVETRYSWFSNSFDASGHETSFLSSSNNIKLDKNVLPALPTGFSLGTTHLAAEAERERYKLTFRYGLSDDITVGTTIGWAKATTKVDFSVLTSTGSNNTAQVQNLLTGPLYNYQPVQTVRRQGSLDPQIFARLIVGRDVHDRSWTVLMPTLRLRASPKDDANNLLDQPIDAGTSALMLGLTHAHLLGDRWYVMGNATLTHSFQDDITARAYSQNELVVPFDRTERMTRRQGSVSELLGELGWRYDSLWAYARIDGIKVQKDRYHSPRGQDVSGLEKETDTQAVTGWLGLTWRPVWLNATIGSFVKNQDIPFLVQLQYRKTLQGRNVPLQQHFYLTLTSPLP